MNDNTLFQIYFNCDLDTKEQTYDFISEAACPHGSPWQKTVIARQLNEREKAGNPLIAENVLLPHIESGQIAESQILLFRLAKPMRWDETTEDIRLIIAILLKTNEEEAVKQKISRFTRSLADEAFVERLITIEKEAAFHQELIKFQEES